MNTKLILLLTALAASAGVFAAMRGTQTRKAPKLPEDIKNWENEGGNVPAIPTPTS